jgi:hypothetical protein
VEIVSILLTVMNWSCIFVEDTMMEANIPQGNLTSLGQQGLAIYETKLRETLEPIHAGESVAIHVDTGDYAIGKSHSLATRELLKRHVQDGRIVTLTIGPPTAAEIRLAARITSGGKR